MNTKTLTQIAAQHPFPDYAAWWSMGAEFLGFMSQAIVSEWETLSPQERALSQIQLFTSEYIQTVYKREPDPTLVERFYRQDFSTPIHSGEFDALSYAFYRSAFEILAQRFPEDDLALTKERRIFAKKVGEINFNAIHDHLCLNLPASLKTHADFIRLQQNIQTIGEYLITQGYLRDHFSFSFDVHVTHVGKHIRQNTADFIQILHQNGLGYALYEMGYPAILPSAVYLYNTHGEAQHHSSRTIEELFDRIGANARETDDFDPTGFPSNKVVELWEIRLS
jgi:hypothetical protein